MTDTVKLGKCGEKLAEKHLKKQKYRILARNYVVDGLEADIVCERGDQLVFVEVKTRSSSAFARPAFAVDAAKRKKYYRIAERFVSRYRLFEKCVRFDIIEVVGGELNHIENAFSKTDGEKF